MNCISCELYILRYRKVNLKITAQKALLGIFARLIKRVFSRGQRSSLNFVLIIRSTARSKELRMTPKKAFLAVIFSFTFERRNSMRLAFYAIV